MNLEQLAREAREGTDDDRLRLIEAVVTLIIARRAPNKTEIKLFEDILGLFLPTLEDANRARISDRLADWPRLPRRLAMEFSKDTIGVARPVLQRSPVLDDMMLVEIMHGVSDQHCIAIARRSAVSEKVIAELFKRDALPVLAALAGNLSVQLGDAVIERMCAACDRFPELATTLVLRPDLPIATSDRIVAVIAKRLRGRMTVAAAAPAPVRVQPARPRHPSDIVAACRSGEMTLDEAISRLAEQNHQTEIAILLSERSGFDEVQVVKVLVRPEASGIQMVMKALGCSTETFKAVVQMRQRLLNFDKLRLTWEVDDYVKLSEKKAKDTLAGVKHK
jgi:uncharacterized protein (DUF2336 family)